MGNRILKKIQDFHPLYSYGKRFRCLLFSVFFLFGGPPSHIHFACNATKKVGNAVRRNRIKRLLKDLARSHIDKLPDRLYVYICANVDSNSVNITCYQQIFLEMIDHIIKTQNYKDRNLVST